MVLESFFCAGEAIKKPYLMAIAGFVLSWVCAFLVTAYFGNAGFLIIAFITIVTMPLIHSVFICQEKKEACIPAFSTKFFERNMEIILIYAFFTIGIAAGYASMYVFLPAEHGVDCVGLCQHLPLKEDVFAEQDKTLEYISHVAATGPPTGQAVAVDSASGDFFYWFYVIFTNNMGFLIAAVIFSFVFGAGAIFLISWTASVLGVWIGKSVIEGEAWRFLGLLPHGIPEFIGFFLGAISGGLLSAAVCNKKKYKHEIEIIATDSALLFAIATASIAVGAAVEAASMAGLGFHSFLLAIGYVGAVMLVFIVIE